MCTVLNIDREKYAVVHDLKVYSCTGLIMLNLNGDLFISFGINIHSSVLGIFSRTNLCDCMRTACPDIFFLSRKAGVINSKTSGTYQLNTYM